MSTILSVAISELRRIVTLRPVFSVLILGVLIYALYYPQPYLNEVLRDVPMAIVDQDNTISSRELARRIDATPDVAIVRTFPDLPTAQADVYTRRVFGILVIPQFFERELLHGRPSSVALYADASYFLLYQRVAGSVGAVARALGGEIEAARMIGAGVDTALATAASDPMPLTVVLLFNPEGGYATYLLPAALVLLLQQTLLIGVALLNTLPDGRSRAQNAGFGETLATIAGKLIAYLVLQALTIPFYLVALPYLYGLPRLGSVVAILIFAMPFVLAVSALGMVLAEIFRRPLTVQLATATLGLPFFFLAGFAWPVSAIPKAVQYVALLVPSSLAIDGFVRVSQLGASLFDVRSQFLSLYALTAFYLGVVLVLKAIRSGRTRRASASRRLALGG